MEFTSYQISVLGIYFEVAAFCQISYVDINNNEFVVSSTIPIILINSNNLLCNIPNTLNSTISQNIHLRLINNQMEVSSSYALAYLLPKPTNIQLVTTSGFSNGNVTISIIGNNYNYFPVYCTIGGVKIF
jgi:hypothetical protein